MRGFNVCQAGHETHDVKTVDTIQGPFVIYDWERYKGFAGYCPGQDDVSMTLDLYGVWEDEDYQRSMAVVETGDVVWDFGSHIGWYTKGAVERGAKVWAVDADPENMKLLNANTHALTTTMWLSEVGFTATHNEVRLVKADVEGAEDEVFRLCQPALRARRIDYLLLECSPEFDDYYPSMIDEIRAYGYTAYFDGAEITGAELGETQKNIWFVNADLQVLA